MPRIAYDQATVAAREPGPVIDYLDLLVLR
jgi:hypothetical protein